MSTCTAPTKQMETEGLQLATFYVGDLLLGLEIYDIQEINRQLEMTPVPGAPRFVQGVINLRGDVVTIVDLRTILGLPPVEQTNQSRNIVLHWRDEVIGIWVDQMSDILNVSSSEIEPAPANVSGVDGRFFRGVYQMDSKIVILLDLEEVLSTD